MNATLAPVPSPAAPSEPAPATGQLPANPDTVAVVGLGYVGLPTAIALTGSGTRVIGLDVSLDRLAAIRDGQVDLADSDRRALARSLADRSLSTTTQASAIAFADAVVICVPTPVDEHLVPDLATIRSACASVVDHVTPGMTVLLTSTTYVGTTRELLAEPLLDRGLRPGHDVFVAFSPERIDPGNGHHPHQSVPRVLGGVTTECTLQATGLLRLMTSTVHPVASPEAAEMTKLYENTFRAVNIALANEMAEVCSTLALDVMEVIEAASTKPYGFMPFYPGPGVGGHCIPCDPHYLTWQLRARRQPARLIESAMGVIADRPARVAERTLEELARVGRPPTESRVLLVGVTYKPGVEDVRESPALDIIAHLKARGVGVDYHDPLVPSLTCRTGQLHASVTRPDYSAYDLVVVHTLHPDFDATALEGCDTVLDATYRFRGGRHRAVV